VTALRALGTILLLFGAPALAQVQQPSSADGDPHVQSVSYNPQQIVQLRSAPGYQLMIELSPDEEVRSVALGDSGSWQVNVSKEGNRLFVKPTTVGSTTNMTVVTSVRVYYFELRPMDVPAADMPYTVQFRYPAARAIAADTQCVDVSSAARRMSRYRLSGDRQLRPTAISNDGEHTYVSWAKSAALPAVYSLDRSGGEVLANGMMRPDDVYVLDGAPQTLVFRIDRQTARAERISTGKKR
jgi:type IV secretion system protein VirB9